MKKIYLFLLILLPVIAFSQTSWKGTRSSSWFNSSNWTNGVPDASVDATIGDANFTGGYQPALSTIAYCKSLIIGGTKTSTLTAAYNLTVTDDVTINANGTLSSGAVITLGGDWSNSGSYATTAITSSVIFAGSAQSIGGANVTTFRLLNINAGSTVTLNKNMIVSGTGSKMTIDGIFDPNDAPTYLTSISSLTINSGGTLRINAAVYTGNYALSGSPVMNPGFIVEYGSSTTNQSVTNLLSYSTLKISGTSVKTIPGNLTFQSTTAGVGNLYVEEGTLDIGAYTANRPAGIAGGNLSVSNGATLRLGGTNSFPTGFSNVSLGTTSTIEYNGAATAQTITSRAYGKLAISGTGTKTAGGALTIADDFSLSGATFAAGSFNHLVGGDWNMTSGAFTNTGSTITLNGSGTQSISSTGAFNNVVINKPAGSATITADMTVTGLTFTKGVINSGTNEVIIASGGTVSGASATTGWVNGRLQKYFSTIAGGSFEVGGPSHYTPLSIAFTTITAGNLIVGATASTHPNISSSTISSKNISRYWTLDKPATLGIAFTGATITFNWNAADNYTPITASALKVAKYTSSAWTLPTVTGTSTTTSMRANGISTLGDFTIGETAVCTLSSGFKYAATTFCSNGGTANITLNTGATAGTFTASPAGLSINSSTGGINLNASTPGTYTVTNTAIAGSCTSISTATIVVNQAASATITYGATALCTTGSTANVTLTGTTGGVFSSTTGLSINGATGQLNLSGSTAGTYVVTYTVTGLSGCANFVTTTSITIASAPTASITYPGSPYCLNGGTGAVTLYGVSGGIYSSTTGLTINATTGDINLATSTVGTYTVTYTIAAANGCAIFKTTASVTIVNKPTATIAYTASQFCKTVTSALATITGTTGGTFSSAAGLDLDEVTGEIDPSLSTAGTYTVTYSVSPTSGCSASTTATVTITAAPSATISYTGSPFCTSGTTVAVNRTGTTGGTYSSTTGLSINASTGDITLSSSTAGTYTVTYTVAASGGCAAFTATTSVTITAAPSATISYTGSPFCTSGTIVAVNRTGTAGGTYTSTTGLSINASTGLIISSSSTAGTYTVTYSIAAANGCAAVTATTSVTITAAPSATISYSGSPYCTSGTTASVTRTGSAGGTYSSTTGLTINSTTGDITLSSSTAGTYTVTYTIAAANGCATVTANTSVTITAAPSATISYTGSPFCTSGTSVAVNRTGTAGGTYTSTTGLSINASTGLITLSSSTAGTYTVTYTIAAANGCAAVTATTSVTISALPSATISYTGSPYCTSGTTASVTRTGTAGGTYSSTTGLTINASTGDITLSSSTAGTYTVTYTMVNGGCTTTATTSVTITAAPSATISYSGSPYCTSGTTASVTRTGSAGGTYTSTTGLTINSTTGDITLSSSTAGTYTVTYTIAAANGCAAVIATTSVTITAAPSATISYTGSPFCTSGTTVAVNRTGTAGGTYTSTTGLSINASTGLITLSSSTAGTYTVTYTIAAASGCAAVTATTSVTITAASSATISYTGSPFCTSGTTVAVNRTGTAGGSYSSTTGLSINASTGLITLSSSTAGTYTVTYTIAAANGCAAVTATTSVTITAAPSATISYAGSPYTAGTGTASVTRTGTSGGSYTSTTGLSINAVTGDVNLATSTAGNYTVTYTVAAANGCSAYTTTTSITITQSITRYYVNDNSTTGGVYTSAVGSDANAGTSSAPFLTINKAISVANAGDTVYVDAGTYGEAVNANKAITLLGANAAISPNTGTRNAESILNNTTGSSVNISTVNRVVMKGFKVISSASASLSVLSNTSDSKITLEKNLFDGSRGLSFMSQDTLLVVDNRFTNIVGSTDRTIFVQGDYNGTTGSYMEVYNNTWINSGCGGMNISSSKADIYNNTFNNIAYQGILVANYSSQNITRNVFTNIYNPDLSVNTWGAGVRFYTPSAGMITTVTNNYFTGNYVGVAIRPTDDVTGRSISINDNSFSGNTYAAINHTGAGLLSANCNWYGSASVGTFISTILGNVNLSPFLTNGTDNNPGTPGFQPVAGSCGGYIQKWTGALTSVWDLNTNWSGGSVPGSNTDIIIPGGLSNYPVINLGTKAVNNVIIQSGGSLTVTGATLQISGSISNSGTFTASNGIIELKGSTAQVISSGAFTGNNVNDLIINNNAGVTLADTLNILDILTINTGTLTTGGYLVLKSSATNTARISEIKSGAAIPVIGNVTVERYIQGRRKYRLITSSVTTSTASALTTGQEGQSIWGNWQNSGLKVPNVGTIITGGTAADGFDTQTTSASIFTYNTATKKFVAYTSTAGKNTKYTPLKAGAPYYMFVYGDRINTVTTSSPNSTVLRATGTILTGDQTYNSTSAVPISTTNGAYSLIGNPYAAIIDWKKVQLSNVSKTIWGWDANLSSTGGYVTVTSTLSGALVAPVSNKIKISQYVQPGQAFFVQTTGSNPSLTIKESAKVDDIVNINSTVFRTTQQVNAQPMMAVNLLYTTSGTEYLADGAIAAYDESFSNEVGEEDGKKLANSAEDVSIINGAELLSIDARQMPEANDTMKLNIARLTKTQYTLEVFAQDMSDSKVTPYLEDTYLRTVQPLSLTDTNHIIFSVTTSVAASAAADRFRIVFKPLSTLPVTFTSITAARKNKDIQVSWNVATESGIQKYEVERSADGASFTKAAEVKAQGNASAATYNWLDVNTTAGNNYYRIRAVQADGQYFYSKVVVVKADAAKPEIKVYPNPIKNQQINLQFTSVDKGQYTMVLLNNHGQQVMKQVIDHPGGSFNQVIPVKTNLPMGVYYMQVIGNSISYGQTLMVE